MPPPLRLPPRAEFVDKLCRVDGEPGGAIIKERKGQYAIKFVSARGGVIYDPAVKGVQFLPADLGFMPRSLVEACSAARASGAGGFNIKDGWRANDTGGELYENFDRDMCSSSEYKVVFNTDADKGPIEYIRDKVGNTLRGKSTYVLHTPDFHVIPGSGFPTDNLRIGACDDFELRFSNKYDLSAKNLQKLQIVEIEVHRPARPQRGRQHRHARRRRRQEGRVRRPPRRHGRARPRDLADADGRPPPRPGRVGGDHHRHGRRREQAPRRPPRQKEEAPPRGRAADVRPRQTADRRHQGLAPTLPRAPVPDHQANPRRLRQRRHDHDLLRHDPKLPLKKLKKTPVLALNGTLDLQVPHAENLGAIEKTLRAAGNKDVTTKTFPGLNHLFQHAVGIVPPDRYRSLIIQATQGCAYNGCLFCSLYKGQRHRVVPPDELRAHVRRVKDFIGSGLADRRGVFLGEANALAMPQPSLLSVLDVVHDELPTLARDVSSFIDAFDAYRSVEELRALAARGLTRVFVGVESGDEATLALLGKPATVAGVQQLVRALKEGGASVGVIFLAGLGEAHVEASAKLCASLGLDARDVVYVSPLVVEPGGPLAAQLEKRGLLRPQPDIDAEAKVLRARLAGRAKVARYDVRRTVYRVSPSSHWFALGASLTHGIQTAKSHPGLRSGSIAGRSACLDFQSRN